MYQDDILTVDEVAEILRVSVRAVREMIKAKELHAVKIGKGYRVRRADIDLLFSNKVSPPRVMTGTWEA